MKSSSCLIIAALAAAFVSSCTSYKIPHNRLTSPELTQIAGPFDAEVKRSAVVVENPEEKGEFSSYRLRQLVYSLRKTNMFAEVELAESPPAQPDILIIPKAIKLGHVNPLFPTDFFYAKADVTYGYEFIIRDIHTGRSATVNCFSRATFINGLAAIPVNFHSDWTLLSPCQTRGYAKLLGEQLAEALGPLK